MGQDNADDRAALEEVSVLIHRLMASGLVPDAEDVAMIALAMHWYRNVQVTADCPVRCLGLAERTYRSVRTGYRVPDDKPGTVGDVLRVLSSGALADFKNVGPRSLKEIKALLVFENLLVQDEH